MTLFKYKRVYFPPLGRVKVDASDGRKFVIKPTLMGASKDHEVVFEENGDALFKAYFRHHIWVFESAAQEAPRCELRQNTKVFPRVWDVFYDGRVLSHDDLPTVWGCTFRNMTFPYMHSVKLTMDEYYFESLSYGYLRHLLAPDS